MLKTLIVRRPLRTILLKTKDLLVAKHKLNSNDSFTTQNLESVLCHECISTRTQCYVHLCRVKLTINDYSGLKSKPRNFERMAANAECESDMKLNWWSFGTVKDY